MMRSLSLPCPDLLQEPEHPAVLKETQGESEFVWLENEDSHNDQGWKLLASGIMSMGHQQTEEMD